VSNEASIDGSSRSTAKNTIPAASATARPPRTPNHSAASTVGSTSRNVTPTNVGDANAKRNANSAAESPTTIAPRRACASLIPARSVVT